MSNGNGWVKLHRQIIDNNIYQHDPTAARVFIHLLLIADHRTGKRDCGRFQLAAELGMNPNTLYKAIKRLEKAKMVTQVSNNKYSTISIVNWQEYQGNDNTFGNNKVTTKEQQSNTKQEIKNKELRIYNNKGYLKTDQAKIDLYEKFPKIREKSINIELEKMIDWLDANGKSKKDYRAFARNWIRNCEKQLDIKVSPTSPTLEPEYNYKNLDKLAAIKAGIGIKI